MAKISKAIFKKAISAGKSPADAIVLAGSKAVGKLDKYLVAKRFMARNPDIIEVWKELEDKVLKSISDDDILNASLKDKVITAGIANDKINRTMDQKLTFTQSFIVKNEN